MNKNDLISQIEIEINEIPHVSKFVVVHKDSEEILDKHISRRAVTKCIRKIINENLELS